MKKNVAAKIYVGYHKPAMLLKNEVLTPIFLGKGIQNQASKDGVLNNPELDWMNNNMIGDDTDNNISTKNRYYCELTAFYWMWKNDRSSASHLGFFHYRRIFSLSDVLYPLNVYNTIDDKKFFLVDNYKFYGFDSVSIQNLCDSYDAIIPYATDLMLTENCTSVVEQFEKHHGDRFFLDLAFSCAKDYLNDIHNSQEIVDHFLTSHKCRFFNVMLLRRDIFNDLCDFLFSVLNNFEKRVKESGVQLSERLPAFISERLSSFYFDYVMPMRFQGVRVLEKGVIQLHQAKEISNIEPIDSDAIPVVLASDDNYAQYLYVVLKSVIDNLAQDKKLDVIVLDGGISEVNKIKLLDLVGCKTGSHSIRFFDFKDSISKKNIEGREQWASPTYYRLFLSEIMNYSKVIWLDSDTICLGDLSKLYEIDVGGSLVAAAPDLFVSDLISKNDVIFANGREFKIRDYYTDYLGLENVGTLDIFQAGVMLLNIDMLQKERFFKKAIECYYFKNPEFAVDQDIFNAVCNKKYKKLGFEWNYVNHTESFMNSLDASIKLFVAGSAGRKQIIHYTGAWLAKPFNTIIEDIPYALEFWKYAIQTPDYSAILRNAVINDSNKYFASKVVVDGHHAEIQSISERIEYLSKAIDENLALINLGFEKLNLMSDSIQTFLSGKKDFGQKTSLMQQIIDQDSRLNKRIRKFRRDPHQFLADSKYSALRNMRFLFSRSKRN